MAKTILVAGYGVGISAAVADRFASEGFSLALVARRAEVLAAAVEKYEARGVKAVAIPADLSSSAEARALAEKATSALGPVTVLHWNANSGAAGNLLTASESQLQDSLALGVTSLVAAVQGALPDLTRDQDGAVLVTNGGLGKFDPRMDALAVQWSAMGLAVANAAKHKAVRVLHLALREQNVYVGEVMVNGLVKGTPWDRGDATLEASAVAQRFWDLYRERKTAFSEIG